MYKHHPTLILGFHACEREVGIALVNGETGFSASENSFDWLGHGMYFWENSPHRAEVYGAELRDLREKLVDPVVIGAVIHLGYCFDLLESHSLQILQKHYSAMKKTYEAAGIPMPINEVAGTGDNDRLLRKLDCAVFQYMHSEMLQKSSGNNKTFDSVRGAFWEGKELYSTSGFKEKNHVQVCIRNPNCIKGFFLPMSLDSNFPRV